MAAREFRGPAREFSHGRLFSGKATSWLRQHPEVEPIKTVVVQSSDERFHCLSIVLTYGPVSAKLNTRALEAARKAVEDTLIEFRDARISQIGRGNGFVVREKDGKDSHIIRLATADGLRIGIRAYLKATRRPQ